MNPGQQRPTGFQRRRWRLTRHHDKTSPHLDQRHTATLWRSYGWLASGRSHWWQAWCAWPVLATAAASAARTAATTYTVGRADTLPGMAPRTRLKLLGAPSP